MKDDNLKPSALPQGAGYFEQHGVEARMFDAAFDAALAHGADWAELYFEHTVDRQIGLRDGAINLASSSVNLGVGVRVVRGNQTGYAYSEELSTARIRDAAATAALIANGPSQRAPTGYAVQALPNRYPALLPWSGVEMEAKLPILRRLNDSTFARDPSIRKVRVTMSDTMSHVLVVDSSGRMSFDDRPMVVIEVACTAERDGRRESNSRSLAGREGFEFVTEARLQTVVKDAVDRTLFLFDARPAPAGEFPLVLAAGGAGLFLHEAIGHGMEADFNRRGTSVYSDRMHTQIAPPEVSIIDSGTMQGFRGAINMDDEGTEGQQTMLVEGGVLRSYLHDRISATHYGVSPTGSGRRQSFKHPPIPRMRTTYMQPGPSDPEEIIRSVARGIYAETFMNGEVNIGAGDFSFYIKTGYLIEGGKLTQPIKDTNIVGNGPECLTRITHVGHDLKFNDGRGWCGKNGQSMAVGMGMPTVKISAITVGGVGP
jgi:TldD protein